MLVGKGSGVTEGIGVAVFVEGIVWAVGVFGIRETAVGVATFGCG